MGMPNYFELFQLPRSFNIEEKMLTLRYHELTRKMHPDNYQQASNLEIKMAEQMLAYIHIAYRELFCPILRAKYLLKISGIDVALETDTNMPLEFLEKQLMWQEMIAEKKIDYVEVVKNIQETISSAQKNFQKYYEENALNKARNSVREMIFLRKIEKHYQETYGTSHHT